MERQKVFCSGTSFNKRGTNRKVNNHLPFLVTENPWQARSVDSGSGPSTFFLEITCGILGGDTSSLFFPTFFPFLFFPTLFPSFSFLLNHVSMKISYYSLQFPFYLLFLLPKQNVIIKFNFLIRSCYQWDHVTKLTLLMYILISIVLTLM